MSKSVTINLGSGSLEGGFPRVTAQIWTEDTSFPEQFIGGLPAAPELSDLYRSWQIYYRSLCDRRHIKTRDQSGTDDDFTICDDGITNISESSFDELCLEFEQAINAWLKSPEFIHIENQLRSQLNLSEEIRVIIETNNDVLRRFPWHCWKFFQDYSRAEVAFARPEYKKIEQRSQARSRPAKVRILAILGDDTGIDLAAEQKFLRDIQDADVTFLFKPSHEDFNLQLWDEMGWDILFFAGHSQTEDNTGHLCLNTEEDNNQLTIKQLEEALKAAIERGLKLAILNSCEGMCLGLALERLCLPIGIVMREPVPNRVAQAFFKFFLEAFATRHQSLPLSVQYARRKLQGLESEFPRASWLPAICLNPTIPPPTWLEMGGLLSCPYKGLLAFQEEDSHLFFGREPFVQTLVDAVKTESFVAMIGASGIGKSSVVFAGLIPQLRQSSPEWNPIIIAFRPEKQPFIELLEAIAQAILPKDPYLRLSTREQILQLTASPRIAPEAIQTIFADILKHNPGRQIVLIADQFEELYTLCSDNNYQRFLDTLLQVIQQHSLVKLVISLRADFYGNLISYRPFSDALQDHTFNLGPMNREELKLAIESPATYMQAQLESGLTEKLIEDVWDQPGNLPLLEFALTELWERRQAGRLTHQAYDEIGGVASSLANHAERVFNLLSESERRHTQKILMQLVQPNETNLPTRRLATREEVQSDNWDLVMHLASHRLVVTGTNEVSGVETVELVHEALIERWYRLSQWVEQDHDFRNWQERLRIAVQQWDECGRDEAALWHGKLLAEAEVWNSERWDELSPSDRLFLELSIQLKDIKLEDSNRRKKFIWASLLTGTTVVLGLGGLAWWEGQRSILREVEVLNQTSNNMLDAEQGLDALLTSLKANHKLKNMVFPTQDVTYNMSAALKNAVYSIHERNRLEGHQGQVLAISFSPDGQTLVSAGEDRTIKIWNIDGTLLHTLNEHQGVIQSIHFNPDGHIIASGGTDNQINLWSIEGKLLKKLHGHRDTIQEVKFSPDGQMLASVSDDKTLKLWSRDGTLLKTFTGHQDSVRSVSFSPDGQTLVTASDDKTIKIWQKDGKKPKTIRAYTHPLLSVALSPDGKVIAATSEDGTLQLWNMEGKLLKKINHEILMTQVIFRQDGQVLISADVDGAVSLWGRDGTLLKSFTGHEGAVLGVAYSPKGQIASASEDSTIKLWSLNNALSTTIQGHRGNINNAVFSPDDKVIATAGADQSIKLWSPQGELLNTLKGHTDSVQDISFSPDGQRLASASWDQSVKIWELDGKLLQTLTGHSDKVFAVSFSPDSQTVVSGSNDGTIKFWNQDGTLRRTIKAHDDMVHDVSFHPNGQLLASASHDLTAKIWDIKGNLRTILEGHDSWLHGIRFSPDGSLVATASHDKTVKLWTVQGELKTTFRGHTDRVLGVAISPTGDLVASSGRDQAIKLWNPNGQEVTTLQSHGDWVNRVQFSHSGKKLLSASSDNTAIVWDLEYVNQPQQLLQKGCAWIQDYLVNSKTLRAEERSLCDAVQSNTIPNAE